MKLEPVRLAPVFVPRIWGRQDLTPLFSAPPGSPSGNPSGSEEPIGEVWLTGEQCAVLANEGAPTGPGAAGDSDLSNRTFGRTLGRTLGELWPQLPEAWTGRRCRNLPRIPLLVKFIFPDDKLSVQVHPGDDYALEHEAAAGGVGKTEMWYAVSARAGAELRLGLLPGVTRERFARAIADGNAEDCLRRLEVRAGDAFFVPAGTAHTIGPGMVLCEVQQHSDLTYRVFDYNRVGADGAPRPLHIRQALEVMSFDAPAAGSERAERAGTGASEGRAQTIKSRRGPLEVTYLAACRYFAVERWDFSAAVDAATSPECFELLVILEGRGRIESRAERRPYGPGQAWLVPAALGAYRLAPDAATSLLRTYVPDLEEYTRALENRKIDAAAVAGLVHR